ncbi:thiosulfate oxidation carrier protein SoxY [Marinobacterium aestuariivivens]|uniref:Thiosulfate oxidation carrier protein SoxY n=1 Tax=Marinobacterium aestuariivivens TaxID=1698799 RepID=A0ABW2A677_9GAMM
MSIDATGLGEPVERILIWADLNPIQHIATLYPHDGRVVPRLSLRIKVQQATAVRAAVLSAGTGIWAVPSSMRPVAVARCRARPRRAPTGRAIWARCRRAASKPKPRRPLLPGSSFG